MGIRSWGSRRIKRYARGDRNRYDEQLRPKIDDLIARLDDGFTPADLTVQGRQIHRLTGHRKGAYAGAIAGRWRLVSCFEDGDDRSVGNISYPRARGRIVFG